MFNSFEIDIYKLKTILPIIDISGIESPHKEYY